MEKKFDFIKNKNLLVIGLGKTGISVIKKLAGLCSSITALDNNPDLDLKDLFKGIKSKGKKNLKIILGRDISESDKREIEEKVDLVITSPGVPGSMPVIKFAVKNKIPVYSELELAWRLMDVEEKKRTVAVTGTNGKTTVVKLIGRILADSGKNCVVCGNVGLPLIDTVKISGSGGNLKEKSLNKDLIRIIEVSSFQLERVYEFKPHISVILNITSDHMDRHETFENYASMKMRLFANQDNEDCAVVNMDDSYINKKIKSISGSKEKLPEFIRYSMKNKRDTNIFYSDNSIFYRINGKEGKISIKNFLLGGSHNISNIMASAAVAVLTGASRRNIEKAVLNFRPLAHRLEYMGYVRGIRCFNDSKSTNPDATVAALSGFGREVTLILGGRDKKMDFSELIAILNKKVKNLILIGESAPDIYKKITENTYKYRIFRCKKLKEAVGIGFKVTGPDEVLMLSPGCASMDMFKDYRERGIKFKSLVLKRK
ncbi:MAG: UDP-N-acetylmuramoyl-L-alanine--D-glutamate ligase [Actinomycetota bacterium]|nr:UDP-N-acetylmuramoyl-L-alanine--D-glutamate ligase [Actinomycetota bacterium]